MLFTHEPLFIGTSHGRWRSEAGNVTTASTAESNGSLLQGLWICPLWAVCVVKLFYCLYINTAHHTSLAVVTVVSKRWQSCGLHGEHGEWAHRGNLGGSPECWLLPINCHFRDCEARCSGSPCKLRPFLPLLPRGKAPGHGAKPPEAGGILISHAKNKIETEKIHSNKS